MHQVLHFHKAEENKNPDHCHDQNSDWQQKSFVGTNTSTNNAACEGPPCIANHSITFRKRRLSINNIRAEDKVKSGTDGDVKHIANADTYDSNEILSSELDDQELSVSEKERNRLKSYNIASQDSAQGLDLPFSQDKVGTFSCHGVEPHPYIVYSDPEEHSFTDFFQKIFRVGEGNKAFTTAKIVTVTESKINQDRGHIICPYANGVQTALFAAYDGHGERGELLAEYTMNALSEKLCNHPHYTRTPRDYYKAFHDIFSEIDRELCELQHLSPNNSGTTACVAHLEGRELWLANVGDSRAVLGRRINHTNRSESDLTHEAIELTKDHTPTDDIERDRIIQAGGFITIPQKDQKGMPARIWLDKNCSQIGLAMSRSVGDHALKGVGVIADPAVHSYHLNDDDEFFIIATDGVWEFISSEEAVKIVQDCFDKGMGASEACKELIKCSMKRWEQEEGHYRDDITAIVVKLDSLWD
jgi:serine/threonine protein phosphatase PrpC